MKLLKNIFVIFWLLILSFFLISCGDNSSSQKQEQIQQIQNIYFNYPVRDYPIGKAEVNQLYWDCSGNDFCSNYNGKFHSGEDWNLKGGSTGEIDEGKPVYAIGEGKVIHSKEEKDGSGNNIGFRVVIEHTGTCLIPAKENIEDSGISYEEEFVGKIYSIYLHLKDVQVSVGDEVEIDKVIGFITKAGTGPHLHFEISKESKIVYESYFGNVQKIVDNGFRDPSDFIEANMIGSKVKIASPSQTVLEESFSIVTETIPEEIANEPEAVDTLKNSGIIAFVSYFISNSEIYIMDQDGSKEIRLTNNNSTDDFPCLSADGSKIAFVSNRDGNDEIYVMQSDGSNHTRITNTEDQEWYPCWSPDGNKISFTLNGSEICIVNIDGSNFLKLTSNNRSNYQSTWSPDGSKIAFTSFRDGNKEIYVMQSDGSNQVRLTNNDTNDDYPEWSPDGKWIVFSNLDKDWNISIMQADGSGIVKLTNNGRSNCYPTWN